MIRVSIRVAAVSLGLLLAHAGLSDNRSLAQGQNSGTVALTGARVIDGTGRPAIEQATIIVAGGKIQEVGPAASVKVPAGATRVDVAGKTIVPGIINAHGHVDAARDSSAPVREQLARAAAHVRRVRRDHRLQPRIRCERRAGRSDAAGSAGAGAARPRPPLFVRSGHRRQDAGRGPEERRSARRPESRHHQDSGRRRRRQSEQDDARLSTGP